MKIKQLPEDFLVEEILSKCPDGRAGYVWFTLEKKDKNLLDIIDRISKQLYISRDKIGYAGLKDKRGITKQTLSIPAISLNKLKKIKIDGVKLSKFMKSSQEIRLGDILENKFRIVARDVGKNRAESVRKGVEKIIKYGAINLFDEQRFGRNKNTHLVGKLILKKKFKEAAQTFIGDDESQWSQVITAYLKKYPHDHIGAIRTLPKTLQMLFVNAYQSHLFNKTAAEYAKKHKNATKLPIVGYDTILENYPDAFEAISKMLKKEKIRLEEFRTGRLPIRACGAERDLLVFPKNLKYRIEDDELNENRLKIIFEFSLPKGSYGTQIIKAIFNARNE